jgi:hypothetical protein
MGVCACVGLVDVGVELVWGWEVGQWARGIRVRVGVGGLEREGRPWLEPPPGVVLMTTRAWTRPGAHEDENDPCSEDLGLWAAPHARTPVWQQAASPNAPCLLAPNS